MHRRTALWTMLSGATTAVLGPQLFAQDGEADPVLQALAGLEKTVGGLHTRIDSLEALGLQMKDRIAACQKNQDDMDRLIAEVADGSKEIDRFLQALTGNVANLQQTLDTCSTEQQKALAAVQYIDRMLKETNCMLQSTNCYLQQANCILCKLPGNIRRAKVRAFLFGFLVGMGVSAAIGGAGGAAGIASVGVW